jgi:UDP-glucuronate 4-epimerase
MKRDFTYIDDIVEGVLRVTDSGAQPNLNWSGAKPDPATSKAAYRIYNIGNNNPVKLTHLIACLEQSLGIIAKKNFLPMQLGDVPETYADVDDLAQNFGFKPETPLERGVDRFVDWYRSFNLKQCRINC